MGKLAVNYDFAVQMDGVSYGFARVSGLSEEQEYEIIPEGGRNWGPVFLPKQKSKQEILILERGIRTRAGRQELGELELCVGSVVNNLIVIALDGTGPARTYTVPYGIVSKIETGGLDAMGHEVLIEKIEIIHNGLTRSS